MYALNILIIATSIFIASAQEIKVPLREEKYVDQAKKWIQDTLLEGVDELQKAEQGLRTMLDEAFENSRKKIQNEYTKNIAAYQAHRERFHPECFQHGLKQLNTLAVYDLPNKNEILMRTFQNAQQLSTSINDGEPTSTTEPDPQQNCVVAAVEDVGLMLYKVARYIATILVVLDDVFNGFHQCASVWWKYITCVYSYISTAIGDVWKTVAGIKELINDISDLSKDVKAEIDRCTHPKTLEIRQQLLIALKQAETCTNKYKPLH